MPPISGSVSTSVASRSGDAGAGMSTPYQYNAAFNVSGSGSASQSQAAGQDSGVGQDMNKLLIYAAAGIAALMLIASVARR